MFSCCCPTKSEQMNVSSSMDQKLIKNTSSPKKINSHQDENLPNAQTKSKKSLSQNTSLSLPLSQMIPHRNTNVQQINNENSANKNKNVQPYFEQKNSPTFFNPYTGSKIYSNKNRGQLFQIANGTEIIFFDTSKNNEFCFRFLLNSRQSNEKQMKSVVNFLLAKKNYKNSQNQLVLVVSSKALFQSKHMEIPQTTNAVFTNMHRKEKLTQAGQVMEIVKSGMENLRISIFDRLIVLFEGQQDFDFIKNECIELTKKMKLQDIQKICWVFPPYMGLETISEILTKILRKFIIDETIQNVVKYIYYDIDVVKEFENFIVVRSKCNQNLKNKDKKLQKYFQTQMCLAMGLLMVQMNETVLSYYIDLVQHSLIDMKFIDYLRYKQFMRNSKEGCFQKLIGLKLISTQASKVLEQNKRIIEHKYDNPDQTHFFIKQSEKKKIKTAFGFQQSTQTGENTPIREEWNDNLRIQDLKIRKGSYQKSQEEDNNLNEIYDEQLNDVDIRELMIQIAEKQEEDVFQEATQQ